MFLHCPPQLSVAQNKCLFGGRLDWAFFFIVILPAMVNAVCQLLVGFIQIIRDIEMRTASAANQNKVKIVGNDDQKNSVEFLEPSKLTHKLEKKEERNK